MIEATGSAALYLNNFFSWQGWDFFQAIGTIAAFAVTLCAIFQNRKHFNKQIKTEQEPFVLATDPMVLKKKRRRVAKDDSNSYVEQYEFMIKNVGKGPALRITGGINNNGDNDAFFADEYPHSYGLSSTERCITRIDKFRIEQMHPRTIKDEQRRYFYLFYFDQLGEKYMTTVEIKKRVADVKKDTPEFYVVMENIKEKIK